MFESGMLINYVTSALTDVAVLSSPTLVTATLVAIRERTAVAMETRVRVAFVDRCSRQ